MSLQRFIAALASWARTLGACAALVLPILGQAQNHVVAKAWLDDPQGQLTWPEVQQHAGLLQPYQSVLSRGFGSSTTWIRLTINPLLGPRDHQLGEPLILRIRPVYLDEIEVYDTASASGLVGITGDRTHPGDQAIEGLDFMVPLARGDSARDIWLKLKSTSTRQIFVEVVHLSDLTRQVHKQELLYALYIGIILVFMAWGLVHWLFSREVLVGAFVLTQLCASAYAFCALGYMRFFWPTAWPALWLDGATSVFSILAVSSAIYFHLKHIAEFHPPARMKPVWQLLLWVLPVKLLLLVSGHAMQALTLNMVEILVTPTLFLIGVIFAQGWLPQQDIPRPALSKTYIVSFYGLLWVILMIAVLPGLALTPGGELPLYIIQVHGLFTAFLIMVMLQYRDRVLKRQQNELAMAFERSQVQATQEKTVREEQEKLLTMLAHELKTPLATMHMRLDTQHEGSQDIRRAIRDMNDVIERCVQTLQLSDRSLQAKSVPMNLVFTLKEAISACPHPQRVALNAPSTLAIQSDPHLLGLIFNNLLENACKYSPAHSLIHIDVSINQQEQPTLVQMTFTNEVGASGWPDASQIFDKYYRSPGARRQAGTGLGLYLVNYLVTLLSGHLAYQAEDPCARFVLSLPFRHQKN